jgi:TATA-binding protein-associated factor
MGLGRYKHTDKPPSLIRRTLPHLCFTCSSGKTLQALVAIALSHVSPSGHPEPDKLSLIVCPSSVVGHWTAEINKFFPNGTVFHPLSLTGSASERKLLWNSRKPSVNIVVTSYAVMRADIELLSQVDWQFCVLDEGHLLKNPKTGKFSLTLVASLWD